MHPVSSAPTPPGPGGTSRQTCPAPQAPLESGVLWVLRPVTMGGWPDSETSTQLWGWRPAWGQSSGEHVSCLDQLLRLQAVSLCLRLPCAYLSPSVSLQDTRLGAMALREARTTSSSPDPEPRPQRAFSSQVPGRARDVSVGPPVSLLVASNLSPSTHPAHAQHTPSTCPEQGCGTRPRGGHCRPGRPARGDSGSEAWPTQQTRLPPQRSPPRRAAWLCRTPGQPGSTSATRLQACISYECP